MECIEAILFDGNYYPLFLFQELDISYFTDFYKLIVGDNLGRYVDIRA